MGGGIQVQNQRAPNPPERGDLGQLLEKGRAAWLPGLRGEAATVPWEVKLGSERGLRKAGRARERRACRQRGRVWMLPQGTREPPKTVEQQREPGRHALESGKGAGWRRAEGSEGPTVIPASVSIPILGTCLPGKTPPPTPSPGNSRNLRAWLLLWPSPQHPAKAFRKAGLKSQSRCRAHVGLRG